MGQLYHNTTYTKIFVGNLAWRTTAQDLRFIFQRFGPVIHANVVYERSSGRSKGYGFVTFVDADSVGRAYNYPFPIIIDGRIINFNLASFPETSNFDMNYPQNEYYPPYYGFTIPQAPDYQMLYY